MSADTRSGARQQLGILFFKKSDELLAGQVWHHVSVNGIFLSLIQAMDLTEESRVDGTAHWRFLDSYEFIDTASIQDPLIWTDLGDSRVRTLIPRDSYP